MLTVADVVLGGGAMHNLTRNSGACRRGSPVLLPVFVAALLVTGAGCRMALPERKIEAKVYPQQDITVTQNQARLRMRALVDPMCGAIEQAADAIIAGTTNRAVQQAALSWKIEGVPAVRQALFRPDPFTAMADSWVLFFQMADYFETGRGQEALHDELTRIIQFLHDERLAALDGLTKERSAALQELHATIAAERHALTSDVEQLSLKVVDHAVGQLARLLGAAMAAAILAACLGVFLVRWLFFRRPLDIRRE